jgi:MFS family permease
MNLNPNLWLRLVPAYALGYFLSYGLRSVNAVIAPELMQDLGITANGLGLLTSAYFLGFGLFQLPLGMLLDHYGPRRVEALLLLVAAMGCLIFAGGQSLQTLAAGRVLIGLGVSACLMGGFKAFSQWFPIERMPSLTATIMVAGGLGALSVSSPVEMVLPILGWRGVFLVMAALLVLAAAFLMTVPDQQVDAPKSSLMQQLSALRAVYSNRIFWRFAPQGCFAVGGFMALQGLWAVPWMMTVNGSTRSEAAGVLFVMALAMLTGFFFVATCSSWLSRLGVRPMYLLTFGMGLALPAELAIILNLANPMWLWPILGFAFSLSNIAYPLLTAAFPVALSGRVNTALNLMAFIGAFALQWGMGAVIDAFVVTGLAPPQAFEFTLGLMLTLQTLAYLWFLVPLKAR